MLTLKLTIFMKNRKYLQKRMNLIKCSEMMQEADSTAKFFLVKTQNAMSRKQLSVLGSISYVYDTSVLPDRIFDYKNQAFFLALLRRI